MKRYKNTETSQLAEILKKDGVISVPTDTVYGLCARITSKKARDNLMKSKNRPSNKLFPVMCADLDQIKSIAIINKNAEILIDNFMPGPITLILKKNSDIPDYITNGSSTIAIRMATSKPLKDLILKTGCPVFMSSANQSGEPTCKTLDEIEKKCPNINAIMEGSVSLGQPSTIVDCTSEDIHIIRKGPITLEQIKKVLLP